VKILVAMSGGVDSSTVAHMLKEQGHEIVGVMFTIWSDPLASPLAQVLPSKCCHAQTRARATQVAKDLDIPLHILDLEEDFKSTVVDPFLKSYKEGKTPNPCVYCNRIFKFQKMLECMEEFGCEKMASGHYARVAQETRSNGSNKYLLLEGLDKTKDQSYFLHRLSQEQLSKTLFPLGSMEKSDVIKEATKYGIPIDPENYQESQDICFFPEKEPKEFLNRHLKDQIKPGNITTEDGEVIGTHRGLPHYTIGQRKGLGVGGLKIPLHVTAKNIKKNTLTVAPAGKDESTMLEAEDLNFISWSPEESKEVDFEARIHSSGQKQKGVLNHKNGKGTFRFEKPIRGISPGQYIVLYRGEEVIGGGMIS